MKKKQKSVLYLHSDDENRAVRDLEDLDLEDGDTIAVYELKETKTFKGYEKTWE